jgi:hypothetical protein
MPNRAFWLLLTALESAVGLMEVIQRFWCVSICYVVEFPDSFLAFWIV